MKRKAIAVIVILIGIGIMVYPILRDYYYKFEQQKVISQWQSDMENIGERPMDDESGEGEPIEVKENSSPLYDLTKEMEALLIIDKISLKVPVLKGVNERNLNLAVASLENTGQPGQVGNYCIAGHRSRSYGLLFNRLNELEKGDPIVIETKEQRYTYHVTDSFIVNPEDVQILRNESHKRKITLITCDYSSKPYLRLIVQGEMGKSEKDGGAI